jgi:uncharacterized membrane protein
MGNESKKRSFGKAVSYRGLIILSDAILVFFITERADVTIWVVILTNVASTLLYFFHERLWSRIPWGRV